MLDSLTTVYGPGSVKIAQGAIETAAQTAAQAGLWTGSGWFQALSTAILVLWCVMIYRYRQQAAASLKWVVDFKAEDPARIPQTYTRFTNLATALAIAVLGLAIVKALAGFAGLPLPPAMYGWWLPTTAVAVSVAMAAIIALRFGILTLAGKLTLTRPLTKELIRIKKTYFTIGAVLLVPPILLYTGLNPVWDAVMGYIAVTEFVIVTFVLAAKTCILFIRQKVSLLVWFLYLCAVEIFPIGFVTLVVLRNL